MARWALEQWELADAYGVAAEMSPPDYLKHLQVCPRYEWPTGTFVLARSASLDVNFSGWVVQCGGRCRRERARDLSHVDADAWMSVPLFTFMKHRPGLVRYLALPEGFTVRSIRDKDVHLRRRMEDSTLRATSNVAMLDLPESALWNDFHLAAIERTRPEPTRGIVELDFERDRDVWDPQGFASTDAVGIVRERHRVSGDVAVRTVAHHQTLPVLRRRIRWMFAKELPIEQFIEVTEVLDGRPGDARAPHAAAMRLREMTEKPFAPLFEIVKRIASARDVAERVSRSPHRFA